MSKSICKLITIPFDLFARSLLNLSIHSIPDDNFLLLVYLLKVLIVNSIFILINFDEKHIFLRAGFVFELGRRAVYIVFVIYVWKTCHVNHKRNHSSFYLYYTVCRLTRCDLLGALVRQFYTIL